MPNRPKRPNKLAVGLLIAMFIPALGSDAAEYNPVAAHPRLDAHSAPTGRILVKFRRTAAAANSRQIQAAQATQSTQATQADPVLTLAHRVGISVIASRLVAPNLNLHVMSLFAVPAADTQAAILTRLRADPDVEYAEPDQLRYAHSIPNDTDYSNQWFLQPPNIVSTQLAAIDTQNAWAKTTGSKGVVIAQLDTGVRFDHPDLLRAQNNGRLLPGYDFVGPDDGTSPNASSTYFTANDGDGWDPDASDPGDWISAADQTNHPSLFSSTSCSVADSSWHGTRTAGILGALSNNGLGVAGTTWNTWILPLRVIGKCGGYDSDIIVAMQWAAGIAVPGVPNNPFPAQIENLSLGSSGACPKTYSDVISNQLLPKGVLVVVSAGNEGGPVDAPANCPGVAGVGGLRQAGTKVGYSSLGPELAISAPAGNCGQNSTSSSTCLYSLETTVNLGATAPGANSYTDQLSNPNLGTSFSAPIVSGIAALMLATNGNLTAPQLIARLKEGSKSFPQTSADTSPTGTQPPACHVPASSSDVQNSECICTLDGKTCGAGMANALGAVNAASRPIAAIVLPTNVAAGQSVTFDASGSATACGHQVPTYTWKVNGTVVPGATAGTFMTNAPSSGATAIQLIVTDDASQTDSINISLAPSSATATVLSSGSAPPANAGSHPCLTDLNVTSPLASATLSASTASVAVGVSVQLSWTSTNAGQCQASSSGSKDGWAGLVASSGSQLITEATAGSYTYTLTCFGTTVSTPQQTTVAFQNAPVVSLWSSADSTQPGQAITLSWSSSGDTSCSASGGTAGDGWTGTLATIGSASVTETTAGTYAYSLSCTNGTLSAQSQKIIIVASSTSSGGGGHGGGTMDIILLLTLGSLTILTRRVLPRNEAPGKRSVAS